MFVGREEELSGLAALLRKKTPSLVTCRGRRRIGKSTLIREFARQADRLIAIEGLAPRPGLTNWDQLQFENLVLNNMPALARHMGLGRTPLLAAAPYTQRATARKKGCQIDLLMRTKHALYVVEIKRRKTIAISVVDEVREKVLRLSADRRLSVRTALVYEGKLDPRVETEGYFDFIIPFAKFLEGA